MNQEALARLRRLGVVKGVRNLKTLSSVPSSSAAEHNQEPIQPLYTSSDDEPRALTALLPGLQLVDTPNGSCYILDTVYPLHYEHGPVPLQALLELSPAIAACFCADVRLEHANFRDFVFLDTETTGLGGAGTLAFMVGAGFYENNAFVVRQYFLRDHGDEPAMLLLLEELLENRAGLITFNGRSFDLPLLDGRFLLNRMPVRLSDRPHVDLLPPSRRLWRERFLSCALNALERNLLGLSRTHEDVPGWAIPALYNDYLRTGDGRGLTRVFYHNRIDMLSMVTLAARIMRQFHEPDPGDHPITLLGLGKWLAELGMESDAERVLRMAAVPALPTELYHQALLRLGTLLKRAGRRDEAVQAWQQVACTTFDDVTAHIELAKYYEWHHVDLSLACTWTKRALALIEGMPLPTVRAELEHRLARLNGKLARSDV